MELETLVSSSGEAYKFKPSLWNRVFMEGGKPTSASSSTFAENVLDKVWIWIFILMVSLYVAAKILNIQTIQGALFPEDNVNSDFDNMDVPFKERYKLLARYTWIYVLLVVLTHVAIFALVYVFIAIYVGASSNHGDNVGKAIQDTFANIFWRHSEGNMKVYLMALGFCLFGLFVWYLLYFAAVRSHFAGITYPDYIDKETSSAEEHTMPSKYIFHYALMVCYAMLFMVGLFILHYFTKPLAMGPLGFHLFLLIAYSALFTSWIGYELEKKHSLLMATMAILFIVTMILTSL